MLVFYRHDSYEGEVVPVVLMDSQRSDDRFGTREIKAIVEAVPPKLKGVQLGKTEVYSVEYSATYSVNGVNPGESWRTRFFGMVKNPPGVLISTFSPRYFVSQESMAALTAVVQRVVNPQKDIVYATMAVRGVSGIVSRQFVAYAAQHRPIPNTSDSELQISGAGFDDTVIRAKKAVRFDKKTPLKDQLTAFLSPEFKVVFETADATAKPVSEIFRAAMPLNELLGEICTQNQLVFKQEGDTITFYDTRTKGSPKKPPEVEGSFLGRAGIMVYNFALSDYTLGQFNADVFDIKLFSSMAIYNDIKQAVFSGLNKIAGAPAKNSAGILSSISTLAASLGGSAPDKYGFFVLAYDLVDGREAKHLKIIATNNWIVSQAKVAGLLENQVYKDALAK